MIFVHPWKKYWPKLVFQSFISSKLSNDSFFTFISHCFSPFPPISMLCHRGITCTSKSLRKTTLKLGERGHLVIFGKVHFGQYIFSKLVGTITLTPVFSRFPNYHFRTSSLVVLLHTASVRLFKNQPIIRMRQRHLSMKTQQMNSEAKHQMTCSIRSRICKSTPNRISFGLFPPVQEHPPPPPHER